MSLRELDRTFPKNNAKITEDSLSKYISEILRKRVPKKHGGVKYLANLTDLETRTVYNWYNAVNAPDLLNFIILAKNIPELFNLFATLCGKKDIYEIKPSKSEGNNCKITNIISGDIYTFIQNEGINIFDRISNNITLNERQKWFVEQIKLGKNIKITDLMFKYSISKTTAERDLRYLKNNKIIKFEGGKRGGGYQIR